MLHNKYYPVWLLVLRWKPPHKFKISKQVLLLLDLICLELSIARTSSVKGNSGDHGKKIKSCYLTQMWNDGGDRTEMFITLKIDGLRTLFLTFILAVSFRDLCS